MKWAALILTAAVSICWAQAPASKNVIGEVTAVNAGSGQLTLKGDNSSGDFTIDTSAKTRFLRVAAGEKTLKNAAQIALSDIGAGDRVLARGQASEDGKTIAATTVVVMTKADIAKKQERDRAEWLTRSIAGKVTAVDPDKKEITVQTRGREPKTVTVDVSGTVNYRRYKPGSVKWQDAMPSALAQLSPGDDVRVLGDKNADGTAVKAEEIVSGSFRTIAGTVVSVKPAANEITIKDLATKQPVTIHLSPDTMVRRIPEQTATFMAMRLDAAKAGAPGGQHGAGSDRGEHMRPPNGASGGQRGGGGPGTGGGPGANRNFDLQHMLAQLPAVPLSELKPGEALIISGANGAGPSGPDESNLYASNVVAGVEPFLRAAPREGGAVNLGAWNLDVGVPEE